MFIGYLDKNFKAVGKKSPYRCSTWSLKRCAYDMDSFTCQSQEIENSKSAFYVLFCEDDGTLRYMAFSGIPKTSDGMTTTEAIDLRRVLKQKVWVEFASYQSATVKGWVTYLMGLAKAAGGNQVPFEIDTTELDQNPVSWEGGAIPATNAVADLWTLLQDAMMRYSFVITAEPTISFSSAQNVGSVVFKIHRLTGLYKIKLSDFNSPRIADRTIVTNVARARNTAGGTTGEWWILVDATTGEESVVTAAVGAASVSAGIGYLKQPIQIETFVDDTFANAEAKAKEALEKNLFKTSVELSLGDVAGKGLESANLWNLGDIYGYNSADDSTQKRLPVYWISSDSSGTKKICFGKLDDYYYL